MCEKPLNCDESLLQPCDCLLCSLGADFLVSDAPWWFIFTPSLPDVFTYVITEEYNTIIEDELLVIVLLLMFSKADLKFPEAAVVIERFMVTQTVMSYVKITWRVPYGTAIYPLP